MFEKTGWLINNCLTCIPGTKTFWFNLLEWLPALIDKTNGYTDYSVLAETIENNLSYEKPYYLIRNATYFRTIHTDIKQIVLIQDVQTGSSFQQQLDVIHHSTVTVFNTNYVYEKYKQYITNSNIIINICPLGIDFSFFKPINEKHPLVLPDSLLFIGDSSTYPKGFNILMDIVHNMPQQNFCFIMKDNFNLSDDHPLTCRVRVFNRIDSTNVRLIINSCVAAICTSYEETQHLSGIECGACDKPIIARKVGIYYDCSEDKEWGRIADDSNFIENIHHVLNNLNNYKPREYFITRYSTDVCKNNWTSMINEL